MSTRPVIIINASSGAEGKKCDIALLEEILSKHGINATISLARNGSETIELAKRAVKEKRHPVVAGGGDGTINAIAGQLINTECVLGLLPLGTLNHFAKDIGIPIELESAVQTIVGGRVIQVDVGEVNGRIFLNNSSLGLYPRLVHHREQQQQNLGRGKWPAFIWAALSVLRRYPFLNVRLHLENQELNRRTPFVFIGNNEYEMESLNIGARSCLDAGKLSLYIAHRTGRIGLLRLAWSGFFGGLGNQEDFDALSTKEVWIETHRRNLRVATDGEVNIMKTPLHYRVLPRALRVIAPEKV